MKSFRFENMKLDGIENTNVGIFKKKKTPRRSPRRYKSTLNKFEKA